MTQSKGLFIPATAAQVDVFQRELDKLMNDMIDTKTLLFTQFYKNGFIDAEKVIAEATYVLDQDQLLREYDDEG